MTNKTPSPKHEQERQTPEILLRLLKTLQNNWQVKLVAFLIAVVLWAFLITQDPALTREKQFVDATITVAGTDAIKRNGYVVTSDLSDLPGVTLTVAVPQGQYNSAIASVYNARIDLSRITEPGTQAVRVQTSNSSTYGTVTEVSPETVELTVEEYSTRYRIPVVLEMTGEIPNNRYASAATIDPPLIAVSGPKSVVNSIVRAEATLDLSVLPENNGLARTAVPFVLKDASGNEVSSDLIQVTSESVLLDSVIVEQTLYPKRVMPISSLGIVVGTPADGYEIKEIIFSPDVITAAGSEQALRTLENVFADGEVDVTGLTASVNRQLRLRRPSEVVAMSPDTLTVAVEIGPVIREKTMEDVRVTIAGGDGKHAYSADVKAASVQITGTKLWLDTLKNSAVSLNVDVTGLQAGVHELPLTVKINGDEDQVYTAVTAPATVRVTIKDR